jgi:hypothetical protein
MIKLTAAPVRRRYMYRMPVDPSRTVHDVKRSGN